MPALILMWAAAGSAFIGAPAIGASWQTVPFTPSMKTGLAGARPPPKLRRIIKRTEPCAKRKSLKTLSPPREARGKLPWGAKLSNAIINEALLLSVIGITAFSILTIDSSSWRGWYPSEILLRVPIDNWRAYESAVSSDPVPIKAAITGATYFIGDWLAQAIELKQQSRSWRDANRQRISKNALVGLLLLGPLAHFYYEFVTDQLDSWPIPAKIVVDQTIYLGVYNTLYCVALGFLGGRAAKDVVDEVRTTFIPLIVAGWKLWPLVGIVTYTLIPSEHRVLWIDAIEVFYSVILSTIANQQKA